MSAPIAKSAVNPYESCIADCERFITECRQSHASTDMQKACLVELNDAIRSLTRVVEIMRANSRFATRYLVDCADVCVACADHCDGFDNPICRTVAGVCRQAVSVCRRGSLV